MTPRSFMRQIEAYNWRMEQQAKLQSRVLEAQYFNTLNAFGVVMVGKKWEWQSPGKSVESAGEMMTQREIADMLRAQGIEV